MINTIHKELLIENGEICAICEKDFAESYEEPKACEECGGDGVLKTSYDAGSAETDHSEDRASFREGE